VMGEHTIPVMLDLVQPLWPGLAPHDRLPMQQHTLGSG
jgi:hypothetical protein